MYKYFGKWKKGSKLVKETSSNKENVNNEDRGKKPRVGVEFSDCEIIGDPSLRRPIDSYPYDIRDELRKRSYWISSSDCAQSVFSRFSALIEVFIVSNE
ncbi:hypothetical protein M9H77_27360 [Catharanthus roseus]|uniref:Uncharacterized protein n=1 Tax=Catharanthus roseus TaxID=4058 RepID=A0ACC0ADR3_CATRO|nr:hypothetical protein M9H77_27360 [Catharanthus roseus]